MAKLRALDDDALTVFRRRQIGLVFQFFNLLPIQRVRYNSMRFYGFDDRRGQ